MITLDPHSDVGLYEQLYQQLRDDIASGRLKAGTRLRSLRELEQDLDVSRTTVSRAYQQLMSEGYVRAVQGSGYYVDNIGPTSLEGTQAPALRPLASEERLDVDFDFDPACIESSLFPWKKWRSILNAAIDYDSFNAPEQAASPKGIWRLRENLARFLYLHRGVRCQPEQVIVCSDAQRAMDVVLGLLDPATHRFAFEEPGISNMRQLILNRGYQVSSVPAIDEHSLKLLEAANCNVVYAMPSCQLPSGTTMSLRSRNLLLRWATQNDAYIIENDHHARFRGVGNVEVPSMQSLDMYQNVVYLGTLAEVLPTTLSLAYAVLPPALVSVYEQRYAGMPAMLPAFYEQAFADLVEDGTLSRYIRKVDVANKRKLDLIAACVREYLPNAASLISGSSAGYAIIRIKGVREGDDLPALLEAQGIRIYSVYDACCDSCTSWEDMFVLGFGSLTEKDIANGCQQLGHALDRFLEDRPSESGSDSAGRFREEFRQAVVEMKQEAAVQAAHDAMDRGSTMLDCLEGGLQEGMEKIGEMFDKGEIGVCELMEAAEVFDAALKVFTEGMSEEDREAAYAGAVVVHTVEGDLHDLGKNTVRALLEANNFKVYDLGRNTSPKDVLAKAEEVGAQVILGSALMTTTMPGQKDLVDYLESEGVRERYYLMFGGAPVTEEWVNQIGGDAYTDTATDAVEAVKVYFARKKNA